MSRIIDYIRFKLATFPRFEKAQFRASLHEPVVEGEYIDFFDDWFDEPSDAIQRVNDDINLHFRTLHARTAIGWYAAYIGYWFLDHNLHRYLNPSDGAIYQETASMIRATIQVTRDAKIRRETGAEESGKAAQATAE